MPSPQEDSFPPPEKNGPLKNLASRFSFATYRAHTLVISLPLHPPSPSPHPYTLSRGQEIPDMSTTHASSFTRVEIPSFPSHAISHKLQAFLPHSNQLGAAKPKTKHMPVRTVTTTSVRETFQYLVPDGFLVDDELPFALVQDAQQLLVQYHLAQLQLYPRYGELDQLRNMVELYAAKRLRQSRQVAEGRRFSVRVGKTADGGRGSRDVSQRNSG